MDQNVKVGLTLAGLGVAIALGMAALTFEGPSYMLWADVIFGFVASGLLLLGLYLIRQSTTRWSEG